MSASTFALIRALTPIRRRLQWRDSFRMTWLALAAGFGLTGMLLILGRLYPILFQGQFLIIGLSLTLFLWILGQIYAWLKPITWPKLAQIGDRNLQLEERLTTALELLEGRLETRPDIQQAQLDDTFRRVEQVSVNEALPLFRRNRLFQGLGVLLAALLAISVLYVMPNPQETALQQQAELTEMLEAEIAALEEIQSDLLAGADPLAAAEIEEISDTLADLIDKLEAARSDLSPEGALAALSEAEQTLTQLDQERLAQEQALNDAAEALASSDLNSVQEAAQALKNGNFQQAAESLAEAGQNPPASQAEADSAADALNQAAQSVAGTNPELAQSLQQAANALQSGDAQSIQQALEQAGQQLSDAGAQQQVLEQLEQALSNIQQARQQLAQQGQGEGEGEGQGQGRGRGEGQARGQGEGEGSGAGNGSGRGDPGQANDGLFSAQGTGGVISTNNGPNQNRLEEYSSIYAPDHVGGEGGEFVTPDSQNSDGGGFDIGETAPNPNRNPGDVTVSYTEVYREYSERAGAALDTDYIPLGMKDYIRQYFGALEPE